MAIGDEDICPYHEQKIVAVFCQTCEEMVCTMCISQGPHSGARHRDHAFLDLIEAYDVVREDMEKITARFRDHLEMKKKERQNIQGRLQQTKFELLRKRSLMERRSRSISDKLRRAEGVFLEGLEGLVAPAVGCTESRWKEAEYEVVSREGMLGSAESLSRLPQSRAVTYLKHVIRNKRDMMKAMDKDNKSPSVNQQLQSHSSGFNTLRRVSLTLHGEKKTIGKVFRMPKAIPSPPRVLFSWCVVGTNSCTLVWKFRKSEKVDRFLVCCHPVNIRKSPSEQSFKNVCRRKNCVKTSTSVFKSGRCQMVLRRLEERSWYKVQIQSMNLMGESIPCVAFFVTRSKPSDWLKYEGEVFTRTPIRSVLKRVPVCINRLFILFTVAMYAVAMLYLAFYSYERAADGAFVEENAQLITAGGNHCRCSETNNRVLPSSVSGNT